MHIYADGSASRKRGCWKAGCGVWFARGSPHNISCSPRGKQTNNRAELTAIILAIRKALCWHTPITRLLIYSDSELCVEGIKTWRLRWKLDGWTRRGKPLSNVDLWKLIDRIMVAVETSELELVLVLVPAHVGIVGNECADKLAGAAAKRAHRHAARSVADRASAALDSMADAMVAALTSDHQARQQQDALSPIASNDPLQWKYVPYHLRRYFSANTIRR